MQLKKIPILAALFAVCSVAPSASAQQGPPALPVTVAAPLAKRITNWDEFSGRFEAVKNVEVRPRVSGVLEQIHFKDGQIVHVGDPLFTIDQRPFQIAVEVAKAEILRTKAQVSLQESEVERATPLARTGSLTGRELETRQANLAVARAQLLSAEATARNAELNLEWTVVRAPIAGRVSDRKVDVGTLVSGGPTTPTLLTTIVSNPVRIKLADEDKWSRTGRMNFVDNPLSSRSGTLRGRATVDNKDELLQPGLFGRIQVFGGEADALLIPDSAVVSDQARKIVFTLGPDNVVKAQPVTLGALDGGLRVVKGGLSADTRVVIDGLANPMVRPGAKVVPQDGQIKAAAN